MDMGRITGRLERTRQSAWVFAIDPEVDVRPQSRRHPRLPPPPPSASMWVARRGSSC